MNCKGKNIKTSRYRCVTCAKVFLCELDWQQHEKWMALCGRTCECDIFVNGEYSHTIGKEIIG